MTLAGCGAPGLAPNWAETAARQHDIVAASPPVAARLLSGFDRSDRPRLAGGDKALFHMTLYQGGEQTGEWLLRLTAKEVPAPDSGPVTLVTLENADGSLDIRRGFGNDGALAKVLVEVFHANGELLGSRREKVVCWHLELGFVSACEMTANQSSPVTKDAEHTQLHAHVALSAFLGMVREHEHLRSILDRILRAPSLWSVMSNFGVRIGVAPAFEPVRAASAVVNQQPAEAWYLPIQIMANASPVLVGSLRVVAPRSPRALCAGVVSLVVMRPEEPGTHLTMQLLAARREP